MAQIVFRDKSEPFIKKDYKPKSLKYKKLLYISVAVNVIQLFSLLWLTTMYR